MQKRGDAPGRLCPLSVNGTSVPPSVRLAFIQIVFFRSFSQFHCLPPRDLNRPSRPSLPSLTLCFVPSAVPPSITLPRPRHTPALSSSPPAPVSVRFISSHPIHSRHSHSHICPSIHLLCLLYFLFFIPPTPRPPSSGGRAD